jgi:hypothetical protein
VARHAEDEVAFRCDVRVEALAVADELAGGEHDRRPLFPDVRHEPRALRVEEEAAEDGCDPRRRGRTLAPNHA